MQANIAQLDKQATLPLIPDLPFEKLVTRGTCALVVALIAAMTVVIWLSVFTRYVSEDPIPWAEQVAKYLMIWAAFLGSSLALREGAHISVNLVVGLFPPKVRKVFACLVILLNLVFLTTCMTYGFIYIYNIRGQIDPMVWDMSLSIPYAAIPVGCLLMIVQLLLVARKGVEHALSSDEASLS
ncbi:TRAP transporter small permease subunit [Pusillimonas sp. TS35]|nr:TRAP transporter small permease subunit [Pusillimonas sp. TS35]